MLKTQPKTCKERREVSRKVYLDGRARRPHHHTRTLRAALKDSSTSEEMDSSFEESSSICPQCAPVLSRYRETFLSMVHKGSELKRKKAINPNPIKTGAISYRDVVKQNEWLRQNCYDSLGNYLYCGTCIQSAIGVSKDRLAKQRNIKRQQSQVPIVEMTKAEIEKQRLSAYVVMPEMVDTAFNNWWRSLEPSATIQVRFPYEHHGNAGKTSNSAKTTLREEFSNLLMQIPNRMDDQQTFIPKFTTIQMPKVPWLIMKKD